MNDLDIYTRITNKIIAALEAGTPPWVRPWSGVDEPIPQNWLSRQPYHGINHVVLSMEAFDRGYSRNSWLTFKQAQALGGQVRKGEHGVNIIYYTLREVDDKDDEPARKLPMIKVFTVFNLEQLDGVVDLQPVRASEWTPHEAAESLLLHSGAEIRHQGYQAFYSTVNDWIYLPPQRLFADAESYYSTALHELTHWTGHTDRLGRKLGNRFGSDAYAMEELIAELGSAFLCAHCHIDGHLQHAAYIENWLEVLRRDKRAVFVAAAQAQKASDYLTATYDPIAEEEMPMAA
jgi:antirestriction protein ArdC